MSLLWSLGLAIRHNENLRLRLPIRVCVLDPWWTNNIYDLLNDALSPSDYEVSKVLFKDQEMIFTSNAVDVHVQGFVTNDEL
jgi:hypothetical protein